MGGLRGISNLTGSRWPSTSATGTDLTDKHHRLVPRPDYPARAPRGLTHLGTDHQDPRRPRPRFLVEAAWRHRARYTPLARPCVLGGNWPQQQPEPAATKATGDATNAGSRSSDARSATSSPSSANSPAGVRTWACSGLTHPQPFHRTPSWWRAADPRYRRPNPAAHPPWPARS